MAASAATPPSPNRRHALAAGIGIGVAIGAVVGMVIGTLLGSGVAVLIMHAARPASERPGYALQFPGNWRVASEEEDFDPDAFFSIDSPGSSFVTIELIDEPVAVDEEVRQCVADYVPEWLARPDKETFTTWGAYRGLGLALTGTTVHGDEGGVRIFAHSGDNGAFVVVEVFYDEELGHVEPGFELIRRSFSIRMQGQPRGQGTRL